MYAKPTLSIVEKETASFCTHLDEFNQQLSQEIKPSRMKSLKKPSIDDQQNPSKDAKQKSKVKQTAKIKKILIEKLPKSVQTIKPLECDDFISTLKSLESQIVTNKEEIKRARRWILKQHQTEMSEMRLDIENELIELIKKAKLRICEQYKLS